MFNVGQSHADLCSYCISNDEDQSVTIENVQATESYLITPNPLMHTMHSDDINGSVFGVNLIVSDNDYFDEEPMMGTIKISGVNHGIYSIIKLDDADMKYNEFSVFEISAKYSQMSGKDNVMITQDGRHIVNIHTKDAPTAGKIYQFTIVVTDIDENPTEHLNYNILVMQDDKIVLDEDEIYTQNGIKDHTTNMLESDSPIEISINLLGFGNGTIDTRNPPTNELINFHIIPEFGIITMLILGIAIIFTVAITSKSRFVQTLRV